MTPVTERDTKLERHLRARLERSKLFVPYLTAGLPSPQKFIELVSDMGSVADCIEVGIPFSDPIMDGPIIQEASSRALEQGVTTTDALRLVRDALKFVSVPLVVMSYYNPIFRIGIEQFTKRAEDAGVSGVIIPDLPFEESGDLDRVLATMDIAHIQLVAPMSGEKRAAQLAQASSGFVYAVSRLGVTGERSELARSAREVVARIRPHTSLPILVGVGITNSEHATEAADWADGVIVGSAIMKHVLADDLRGALGLAKEIRQAMGKIQG